MPITRRFIGGPFSAIVFRSSDPEFYEDDEKNKGMHLADMLFVIDSEEVFKELWDSTHNLKKRFMGNEISNMNWAQITFALPSDLEKELVPETWDKWGE
jgi:hypothetical protein